jgi:hypothetical protein
LIDPLADSASDAEILDTDRLRIDISQCSGRLTELGDPAMAVRVQGWVFGAACGVYGHIGSAEGRVPAR